MSTPDLLPWQLQLGDLLLGDATPYDVAELEGLDELPELRGEDTDRPASHGEHTGIDYASGRTVTMSLEIAAEGDVSYPAALAALRRATTPTPDGSRRPFWFALPDQPVLRLDVKVRHRRIPTDQQYEMGLATALLELRAADPFAVGSERTVSTYLPAPGGGLVYPLTYPLDYGTAGISGRVLLTNAGTAPAWATHTVYGPFDAQGFELVDVATARRIVYSRSLEATSWVVVDTAHGRVLEQGTAPRRGALTRAQWSPVPAGGSQIVQINPLGLYNPAARMDSTVSDTYWL